MIYSFDGPLDLLLSLIEKNKINIYDISIYDISTEYLENIDKNAENYSSFLVIASTLIKIKSKHLLPKKEREEIELDELELYEKLTFYKKIKEVTKLFDIVDKKNFYKDREVINKSYDKNRILENIDLDDLYKLYISLVKKNRGKDNTKNLDISFISRDIITIEDRKKYILDFFYNKEVRFEDIFDLEYKEEKIVTFLALLDLIKNGILKTDGNIIIRKE